ncbi:MAG: hypothetical protein IJZ64_07225 [Ruminococcus sp.]|nr:hypothetical protein [Ruminococcus sp.]
MIMTKKPFAPVSVIIFIVIKILFILVTILISIIIFFHGCSNYEQTFISPESTHTIIVEYDFASRPTVYEKKKLGKSFLWAYEGVGFNENVYSSVEWISEDIFEITFYGETITIDLS